MKRVCLACCSPIPSGKTKLKMEEEQDSIVMICPICYTQGQIISSKRLVRNTKVQEIIQKLEFRKEGQGGVLR